MMRCADCKYWDFAAGWESGYGVTFAPCIRFPPVAVPAEYPIADGAVERIKLGEKACFFDFPQTATEMRCGEFKAKTW